MADQEELFWQDDSPRTPGEVLRDMLTQRGWTQDELALIMGISRVSVSNLIAGRSGITAEMASTLAAALGTSPAFWMRLDAVYRLSRLRKDHSPIERRAKLFQMVPIRDMQKRGWIGEVSSLAELETELAGFFGQPVGDEAPEFGVATRKTGPDGALTPAERAWCFEARRLAGTFLASRFVPSSMDRLASKLRKLAAFPKEARHTPTLLADFGIRFVVVEPIAGAKIDGAAFWLDDASPVIAVSLRFDRIDAFWFTVLHEWAHIKNGDGASLDTNLVGENAMTEKHTFDVIEQRANKAAASVLLQPEDLDSFVRRVGPLYSKKRIIQFAHTVKIHPGIIVGQLQHRGEITYAANRDLLARVRDTVTETALTDGWGHSIAPSSL